MFLQILRVMISLTGEKSNSVQYYMLSDYTSVDEMVREAKARYHNIISADLQNDELCYNACYIIQNNGTILEYEVFDRRTLDEVTE